MKIMARMVDFTPIWVLVVSFVLRDVLAQDNSNQASEINKPGGHQEESKFKFIARNDPSHKIISDIREMAEKWRGQPKEALKEIDALIEKHANQLKPLGELYWQKTFVLLEVNRNIEALIEAKKSEEICAKVPECYPAVVLNLINEIEFKMKEAGDYAVLGLQPPVELGEIKKAYRRLVFLLHPDKNLDINPEGMDFMKRLFIIVSESYKRLVEEKRHSWY